MEAVQTAERILAAGVPAAVREAAVTVAAASSRSGGMIRRAISTKRRIVAADSRKALAKGFSSIRRISRLFSFKSSGLSIQYSAF